MNRAQLYTAIRAAKSVGNGTHDITVIGSQAILGTYSEDELPRETTLSREADIFSLNDDSVEMLGTDIDGKFGQYSDFDNENGFYIHGVSKSTAQLSPGWEKRRIRVDAGDGAVGWCLEKHDVCASKLMRFEPRDKDFVRALADAGLIDLRELLKRVQNTDTERERRRQARTFVEHLLAAADPEV